jgi:hypothetical protein
MRKWWILLTVFVVIAAVASGIHWYSRHGVRGLDICITQEQIDAVLAKKFPRSKVYLKVIELTLENPVATPVPGTDKVRIGLDARARIGFAGLGKEYDGGATILTRVRYGEDDKCFYLCDAVFERLDLPKVPEKHRQTVMNAASMLSSEILNEVPVYMLSEKDTKQNLARWLLKEVIVVNDEVHVRLGL